jgi:SPP1 gp7 family putative phage head morphogenesis protein
VTPRAERALTRAQLAAAGAKRRPGTTLPAAELPHAGVVAHTRLWLDVSRAMDEAIYAALRDEGLRLDAEGEGPLLAGPARVRVVEEIRRRFAQLAGRKQLVGRLDAIAARVGKMSQRQWDAALKKFGVTPADVDMAKHVGKFRRENVKLITSLAADKVRRVRSVLAEAGVGARPEDIAKRIREETGATESRAALIARDQTLKLFAQVTEARHAAAGITQYEWSASMDARTRPDHRALNGRVFSYADPPVADTRTGERANPGTQFQCRCVALPVVPTG